LASALLLSSGGIAASNVNTTDGDDVCGNFSKLHQESGSGAVHSAAAWALSKWNEPIRNKDGKYKVPSEDSDWYVTTTGVTMIRIRKGQFERRREGAEKSQFVSITQEFELADREVSVERFERFADEMMKEWNGHHKEFSPTESHPIQKVGWTDAIRFCNWLSAKEGLTPCYRQLPTGWERIVGCLGFRLPTEAEWEYACRAGTTTQFACGGADDLSAYAVVNASRAAPCGSRMPNGWGLFDMHGNVWEWCEDSYGPYDDSVHVRDPVAIAKSSDYRVIRGGSFYALSNFLASEYRYADGPDIRFNNVGFRVARTRE
jgi:formylglycine-generating enzyme required for sulfatase activity